MHRRFTLHFSLLIVVVSFTGISCGRTDNQTRALLSQLRSANKARIADALQKQIDQGLNEMGKDGHVIVGQLVLEGGKEPRMVQPQMHVLEEGYFAGAVRERGKPVGFRLHGYKPVDVAPAGIPGSIEHLGVVRMDLVPKDELAKLKGKVEIEDRAGRPELKSVRVTAEIGGGPVNTPSGGTQGVTKFAPPPIDVPVTESGDFTADGFSPTDYFIRVSAPGCVEQIHRLNFAPGQTLPMALIRLEIPRRIKLEYAVSDTGDFSGAVAQETTVVGGERWKAGTKPSQYAWDLEFKQSLGKVTLDYVYGPCEIADLGEGTFAALRPPNMAQLKFQNPQGLALKNGHVYLLNQQAWNHWVLFRAVVEP